MTSSAVLRAATTIVAVAAIVASGCSNGATDTEAASETVFVGFDGVAVESPDTARIVTLSGDLTELADELGRGDSIVATDITTVAPEEAVLLPKAGIGGFLTAEGVLKHNPTLVIGDAQTAPPSAIEQIRSAGVPVAILDVPTTFEELYSKVTNLGTLLDSPDLAADLNERIRAEVEAASVDHDGAASPRVAFVYTRGPDAMLLFGAGMTTNPVIVAAGGIDAGTEAGVKGQVRSDCCLREWPPRRGSQEGHRSLRESRTRRRERQSHRAQLRRVPLA